MSADKKISPAIEAALEYMRVRMLEAWDIYQNTPNDDFRQLDFEEFVFEVYGRLNTTEQRKETVHLLEISR